jgi:hypothetical protein
MVHQRSFRGTGTLVGAEAIMVMFIFEQNRNGFLPVWWCDVGRATHRRDGFCHYRANAAALVGLMALITVRRGQYTGGRVHAITRSARSRSESLEPGIVIVITGFIR